MKPAELGHQAVRGGISALGHLYLAVRPATASVNLIFVEKKRDLTPPLVSDYSILFLIIMILLTEERCEYFFKYNPTGPSMPSLKTSRQHP